MANRPLFVPVTTPPFVKEISVEFLWHAGMSASQKRKSVRSLHDAATELGLCNRPLEISGVSELLLGTSLSAFSLEVAFGGDPRRLECVFQAAKKFENGGPYMDLREVEPRDAKRDERLNTSGELVAFEVYGTSYPLVPTTAFYDFLYLLGLTQNPELAVPLVEFDGFTDIQFNPERSLNCQARSAAMFVGMTTAGRATNGLQFADFITNWN